MMQELNERRNTYKAVVNEFGKYVRNFESFCNDDYYPSAAQQSETRPQSKQKG